MRFTLLLLLTVIPATVVAIQCLDGSGESQDDTAAFKAKDCGSAEQYCFWRDAITFGTHAVTKGCGGTYCKKEGDNGDGYECCKGDFCNSAAGNSLLMVAFVAVTTMWMRS